MKKIVFHESCFSVKAAALSPLRQTGNVGYLG
jgi:hypothetical protein